MRPGKSGNCRRTDPTGTTGSLTGESDLIKIRHAPPNRNQQQAGAVALRVAKSFPPRLAFARPKALSCYPSNSKLDRKINQRCRQWLLVRPHERDFWVIRLANHNTPNRCITWCSTVEDLKRRIAAEDAFIFLWYPTPCRLVSLVAYPSWTHTKLYWFTTRTRECTGSH